MLIFILKVEEYGREMYKITKVFQAMKKEAEKEKKGNRRVKDSKEKEEPGSEIAALVVSHAVQQQIREFKVSYYDLYFFN